MRLSALHRFLTAHKHLVLLASTAVIAFSFSYGTVVHAWPWFGRDPYYGYFGDGFDTMGADVFPADSNSSGCAASGGNAIPTSVNTASEFIAFVKCKLNSPNSYGPYANQEKTGAAFVIQTMIGTARNKPPTAAQISEWESRVNWAASTGNINWNFNFGYSINSYYQGTGSGNNYNDDAFFPDNASGTAIVFKNASGVIVYGIRRQCFNPVGNNNFAPLQDAPNFNMVGSTGVDDATPFPGQQVTFSHYVRNSSTVSTSPTSIYWVAEQTVPSLVTVGGAANGGIFSAGQSKNVFNHTITIPVNAAVGSQICERTGWDPDTPTTHDGRGAPVCVTVQSNYNLTPSINVLINGASVAGNVAEVGDTLQFIYSVNNSAAGASPASTACNIVGLTRNGYYTIPTPYDSVSDSGFSLSGGCPRAFPGSTNTTIQTENVAVVTGNRSMCRSLFVNPASPSTGSVGTEACVYVVNKPYVKTFGGDVMAGAGLSSSAGTCSSLLSGGVVGWNKRAAGNWAGAASQDAVLAFVNIVDFATAQNGGTISPTGLAFKNTVTNPSAGLFGGNLGSLPCIPDYYSRLPSTATNLPASPSVSSLANGTYKYTGNVNLAGGTLSGGKRITIYVSGNVYVTSNITYTGSWPYDQIPQFQLIVSGNIYIDNNISQIDGLYVAQGSGTTGKLFTCATSNADMPLNGSLLASCNTKLTVNGALTANQIMLTRTYSTLFNSVANENPSSASNAAENINYNPSLWINQPSAASQTDYDSITTLPPIL